MQQTPSHCEDSAVSLVVVVNTTSLASLRSAHSPEVSLRTFGWLVIAFWATLPAAVGKAFCVVTASVILAKVLAFKLEIGVLPFLICPIIMFAIFSVRAIKFVPVAPFVEAPGSLPIAALVAPPIAPLISAPLMSCGLALRPSAAPCTNPPAALPRATLPVKPVTPPETAPPKAAVPTAPQSLTCPLFEAIWLATSRPCSRSHAQSPHCNHHTPIRKKSEAGSGSEYGLRTAQKRPKLGVTFHSRLALPIHHLRTMTGRFARLRKRGSRFSVSAEPQRPPQSAPFRATFGGGNGRPRFSKTDWYSRVGSNHRPPDPQSGALTN